MEKEISDYVKALEMAQTDVTSAIQKLLDTAPEQTNAKFAVLALAAELINMDPKNTKNTKFVPQVAELGCKLGVSQCFYIAGRFATCKTKQYEYICKAAAKGYISALHDLRTVKHLPFDVIAVVQNAMKQQMANQQLVLVLIHRYALDSQFEEALRMLDSITECSDSQLAMEISYLYSQCRCIDKHLLWYGISMTLQAHNNGNRFMLCSANNKAPYLAALFYFIRHANAGNHVAMYTLGSLYLHTDMFGTIKQDYNKAMDYLIKAANLNNVEAMYMLGNLCAEGNGIRQDLATATHWYTQAAKQNHELAKLKLKQCHIQGYK